MQGLYIRHAFFLFFFKPNKTCSGPEQRPIRSSKDMRKFTLLEDSARMVQPTWPLAKQVLSPSSSEMKRCWTQGRKDRHENIAFPHSNHHVPLSAQTLGLFHSSFSLCQRRLWFCATCTSSFSICERKRTGRCCLLLKKQQKQAPVDMLGWYVTARSAKFCQVKPTPVLNQKNQLPLLKVM